jgi:elongation factor G
MNKPNPPKPPIISVAISPRIASDREKLLLGLGALVQEDQSIRIKTESDHEQIVISGANDLDLEDICGRITREFKIELYVGEPKVIYLETIRKTAEAEGKYIRQTGGSGNYGHCKLRIEPNEPGKGYEFINEIKGGVVPKEYIGPIGQGVQGALQLGILAGFPIVDVKVTLCDGSYHEVDSNEMAFKFAGSIAFKEAARKASPVLLEPVMAVEVTVPEEFLGATVGDINSRRGRIEGMEAVGRSHLIIAEVPFAEMLGYGRKLHSITAGRAEYSMQFARYEPVPYRSGSDDDGVGVAANRPKHPNGRSGSTAARLNPESE